MPLHRWRRVVSACLVLSAQGLPAHAQGITTAAIRGTVRLAGGAPADGARVAARHAATGFVVEAEVRNGHFLIQGLEAGGPYALTVRRIGARVLRRDSLFLSLGEPLALQIVLESAPQTLDSLVVAAAAPVTANAHGGTATTISDSLVHHLSTLNRDVYDFARLVPQVSTRIGPGLTGMSVGGVGFRYNQFLTNGVAERSLAGGQPPEFAGGKSLPFEAVREYQVLVAPFDVRYGDFAGGAVNTVTRSGGNRLGGSLVVQSRNDAMARGSAVLPYERWLFGGSVAGALVRDRAHFLVAAEAQRFTAPMPGPYIGDPPDPTSSAPVSAPQVAEFQAIMRGFGLEAGSAGAVQNRNPQHNLFARLDAALPRHNTRAVLWASEAGATNLVFARSVRDTAFLLSSQSSATSFRIRTAALQLQTELPRGRHNEFFVAARSSRFRSEPEVRQPIVTVTVPAASGSGFVTMVSGTPVQAQGGEDRTTSLGLRDNLSLPVGAAHLLTLGAEAEWFRIRPGGLLNAWGTWTFSSLDSLVLGQVQRYDITLDYGAGSAPLSGRQIAVYAGDRWQVTEGLALTGGLRGDHLAFNQRPPRDDDFAGLYSHGTDEWPDAAIEVSPRLGFTWGPDPEGRTRIRGGAGVFAGRPPLAWIHASLRNYGSGSGQLRCTGGTSPPPPFEADYRHPVSTCGNGQAATPAGDVELIGKDVGMARTLKVVLAGERRLSRSLVAVLEGVYTRGLSDLLFANVNLSGPVSAGPHGRVLYGVIAANGRTNPAVRSSDFPSIIELQEISGSHSTQLSARLERQFGGGSSAMASYTWSRVRDVQTPLRVNNRGVVNWSSRATAGRHEDLSNGISSNDIPHRVVLAGTWRAPWRRFGTEISLVYVGESGSPFTYRTFGSGGLGDLNADGNNTNDPIYVPLDASDPAESLFSGVGTAPGADNSPAAQEARIVARQRAFEAFIESSPCLRKQRGAIVTRNSCREPWSHTTVMSVRQEIPIGTRMLEAQVDLYNLLNLMDGSWGLRRTANPALLEHVGQVAASLGPSQPVFQFDPAGSPWTVLPAESAFQLQLGVRYRF